jgi:hypothetical protein
VQPPDQQPELGRTLKSSPINEARGPRPLTTEKATPRLAELIAGHPTPVSRIGDPHPAVQRLRRSSGQAAQLALPEPSCHPCQTSAASMNSVRNTVPAEKMVRPRLS